MLTWRTSKQLHRPTYFGHQIQPFWYVWVRSWIVDEALSSNDLFGAGAPIGAAHLGPLFPFSPNWHTQTENRTFFNIIAIKIYQEILLLWSLSPDVASHSSWYVFSSSRRSISSMSFVMQMMKHQARDLPWWPFGSLAEPNDHSCLLTLFKINDDDSLTHLFKLSSHMGHFLISFQQWVCGGVVLI
jgi:hypothetical protein